MVLVWCMFEFSARILSASVDADDKHSPVKTHIRMYCFCLALRIIHLNNGGGCLFCFVPFYTYVRMCIRIYPPILPAIERVGVNSPSLSGIRPQNGGFGNNFLVAREGFCSHWCGSPGLAPDHKIHLYLYLHLLPVPSTCTYYLYLV